ncbi:unnamed protein product [Clonostachys chloroleuca]|uniref:Uncharacterized protein n=1 Tax=Clonostachys chloroleuca TaxID=1926264 RepID=A0AA35LRE2_9HYPO|nr:unnamed protein product [Clonostachys chloroleuca]
MKPFTLLLFTINSINLASAAAIVGPNNENSPILEKRSCFKAGASFGSQKQAALKAVQSACSSGLKGRYNKHETRNACYKIGGNKNVRLAISLSGPKAGSTGQMTTDECIEGLYREIAKCSKGGDSTFVQLALQF